MVRALGGKRKRKRPGLPASNAKKQGRVGFVEKKKKG